MLLTFWKSVFTAWQNFAKNKKIKPSVVEFQVQKFLAKNMINMLTKRSRYPFQGITCLVNCYILLVKNRSRSQWCLLILDEREKKCAWGLSTLNLVL